MNQVIEVKSLGNHYIWLKFSDGEVKVVNLKPFIGKGFTKDLLMEENFKKVFVDAGGGIAWDNGFDFCPNFLRQLREKRHMA